MRTLSGKELKSVMNEDVYFAIPTSVIKWLNTINLNSSQRMIIERMIGFAIQRPTRSEHHLQARLSLSLISEFTSIKERTVINSIHYLESIGIIQKFDVNKNGTLYQVNLSAEIKGLIRQRYKPSEKTLQTTKKNNSCRSKQTTTSNTSQINNKAALNDKERTVLIERLNNVNKKIKDLKINLPENFTPIMLLRGKVDFDEGDFERLTQLSSIKEKLEMQIGSLPSKECVELNQPNNDREDQKLTKSFPKKQIKKDLRHIRSCDSKALMTRIRKFAFFRSDAERMKIFKEVIWAIRFGWYRSFKGSTYHCTNHALKLIKNNDWRTPSGYAEHQIAGLIEYQGIS